MSAIESVLQATGLVKNEIKVYLTLLRIGQAGASAIAENSKLHRPYVYDTLGRLEERSLVSQITINGAKQYKASDPEALIEQQETQLEEIKAIVPSLKKMVAKKKSRTLVETFTGKRVVRTIQKDVLETLKQEKKESLVIGVDERLFQEQDPVMMEQFFAILKRHKLKERVLLCEGSTRPADESTTTYRLLPEKYVGSATIFIYGDRVTTLLFEEPLYAIRTRSKALADTYREQFEMLWNAAGKN